VGADPPAVERNLPLRGAQSHLFTTTDAQMTAELDVLEQAGATSVRIDVSWASLEPSDGSFDLELAEGDLAHAITEADARGIKPLITLFESPCWASSAPAAVKETPGGCEPGGVATRYSPVDAADYGQAAAYLAERWGDRIIGIEVWNEPDVPMFLRDGGNEGTEEEPAAISTRARAEAAMTRAAYEAVKTVSPETQIVTGAVEGSDADFVAALYKAGIAGHYDALSIHPYNGYRAPRVTRNADAGHPDPQFVMSTGIPRVRDVMTDAGDAEQPLWLTELGWSTCTDDPDNCLRAASREESYVQQGRYIREAFELIRDEFPYVTGAFVYELRDRSARLEREQQYGILESDFTPKEPSLAAFARAMRESGPAAP